MYLSSFCIFQILDTRGFPLPLNESSKEMLNACVHNDTLFLNNLNVVDYSLLVGLDIEKNELVVGIIDYIRQYTWDKQLETGVKSLGMIAGRDAPTVISPKAYKSRFRIAIDRYFMTTPTRDSHLPIPTDHDNDDNDIFF